MKLLRALLIATLATTALAEPPADPSAGAWLGVLLEDAVDGGVELVAIVPASPAARAGLRPGDVIVAAGETRTPEVDTLTALLDGRTAGDQLNVELIRSGRTIRTLVRLASRPEPGQQPPVAAAPVRPTVARTAPLLRSGLRKAGLTLAEVTPDLRVHYGAPSDAGLLVTDVVSGRPADSAGLRVGDVLVRLNGQSLTELAEAERLLISAGTTGRAIEASVVRESQPTVVRIEIVDAAPARPPRPQAPFAPKAVGVEKAIEREIERLERRIRELRRELDELRDTPEPPEAQDP